MTRGRVIGTYECGDDGDGNQLEGSQVGDGDWRAGTSEWDGVGWSWGGGWKLATSGSRRRSDNRSAAGIVDG